MGKVRPSRCKSSRSGGEEAIGSYILPFPDSADLTIRRVLRHNKELFQ